MLDDRRVSLEQKADRVAKEACAVKRETEAEIKKHFDPKFANAIYEALIECQENLSLPHSVVEIVAMFEHLRFSPPALP